MTWSDISVAQFMELYELKQEDCENLDEFVLQRLCIIFKKSQEEIYELYDDQFNDMVSQLSFLTTVLKSKAVSSIKIGEVSLHKIVDLFKITVGEFIDLENLFDFTNFKQQSFIKNLPVILSIFYRQKEIKNSPLFPDEFETYGNWIFHRAKLFDEVSINDVFGIVDEYILFKTKLREIYHGLFNDPDTDEEDEPLDEMVPIKKRGEQIRAEEEAKVTFKWQWDLWLYNLSKEYKTSISAAANIPLIEAYNLMSMKQELKIKD